MVKIFLLTSNEHKVNEIREILNDYNVEVEMVKGIKVEIQELELDEIIRYAALKAKEHTLKRPLFLEDSGLFIRALGGFPGPFSRYVYDTIGVRGVLKLMEGIDDRKAEFRCAAACVCPDERIIVNVGKVEGTIALEARGKKGFGFDPIFVPRGFNKTFAEMDPSEKNSISHRARAFRGLIEKYLEVFGDTE
ncbi:deoxyribonucleotide triphosphate pyrophosphatase [Ignicoccus pacificus DSM 13166]|uniref:dITP/XTP pyrophosphatase n=1 Tax=Ignicoccus pacificus DSM 13166 TaxID=940294 RepID=A0A977K9M5_9CREN|nr:deoxyribonucleotide triphosphate pyrophosphatase [Ignicoccus pacificus DSM 13166]